MNIGVIDIIYYQAALNWVSSGAASYKVQVMKLERLKAMTFKPGGIPQS